jgi:hypothetical protein
MAATGDDRIDSVTSSRRRSIFRRWRSADFRRRGALAALDESMAAPATRRQDGQRLQHAAAERTHLELCRQQLHEGVEPAAFDLCIEFD